MRTRPLILIADDDEDILELVRLRLNRGAYDTVCARDGAEALELARGRIPDLAVLDVTMPALDGHQVAAKLRHDILTSEIPIILLTARVQPAEVAAGLAVGADDYVTKPFSPAMLENRVASLLKAAEARHQPAMGSLLRCAEARA